MPLQIAWVSNPGDGVGREVWYAAVHKVNSRTPLEAEQQEVEIEMGLEFWKV